MKASIPLVTIRYKQIDLWPFAPDDATVIAAFVMVAIWVSFLMGFACAELAR